MVQLFWPTLYNSVWKLFNVFHVFCCYLSNSGMSVLVLQLGYWVKNVVWVWYTGTHCEVDLSHNCSHDTCVGGARCVPLIRGGFRCELCRRGVPGGHAAPSSCLECDSVDERSPFCELLSRAFTRRGSFLMFPPLKQRHRFHIKLRFVSLSVYSTTIGKRQASGPQQTRVASKCDPVRPHGH